MKPICIGSSHSSTIPLWTRIGSRPPFSRRMSGHDGPRKLIFPWWDRTGLSSDLKLQTDSPYLHYVAGSLFEYSPFLCGSSPRHSWDLSPKHTFLLIPFRYSESYSSMIHLYLSLRNISGLCSETHSFIPSLSILSLSLSLSEFYEVNSCPI